MRVVCVRRFRDKADGVTREVGDTFDATAERLSEINSTRYGILAEKVAQKPRTARTKKKE